MVKLRPARSRLAAAARGARALGATLAAVLALLARGAALNLSHLGLGAAGARGTASALGAALAVVLADGTRHCDRPGGRRHEAIQQAEARAAAGPGSDCQIPTARAYKRARARLLKRGRLELERQLAAMAGTHRGVSERAQGGTGASTEDYNLIQMRLVP